MKTPTFITATALAVGIALTSAGAVSAQTPEPAEPGPRLERLCARVPNLQIRVDNVLERINGDATTRGSLAWLDTKIAKAEELGRTDLAEVLRNRKEVRTAAIDVLELRRDNLAEIADTCAELGAS
jgi:hypothetical protein